MLLLTRRKGEAIIIDGDIEVIVMDFMIGGKYSDQVRIGIQAPRKISVHRKEIQAKVDAEQE